MTSNSNQELLDSDTLFRQTHPAQKLRANFYHYIGDIPQVAPRDYATCRQIVTRLQEARTVCAPLTSSEHSKLTYLINRWEHRASGMDQRFNVVGTRPGALTTTQRERMLKLGWFPEIRQHVKLKGLPKKRCLQCKSLFLCTRSDKKYCSDKCRQLYWDHVYSGA